MSITIRSNVSDGCLSHSTQREITFFLRKFQKSLQEKRNEHILKSQIYLITCKLSQKTDPKGEKQQYSLDSVNERRLLLFTFSLASEYCSFRGKHVLFHGKN